MNRNSLQLTYKKLNADLWDNFIFFIPEFELPKELLNEIDFLNDIVVFNKPMYYKRTEGVYFYENEYSLPVLSKWTELETNLFSLLELRGNLKSFEFDYVIEKYFEMASNLFLYYKLVE